MESQLQHHPHGHHEQGGGEGEKKSVLKKVKDKAKKIKDTIKKHGHRRGDDIYQQGYEEEEVDSDPEVHGAPMYESSAIRSHDIPRETIANLEKPTDRYNHNVIKDEGTTQQWPFISGHSHRPMKAPATTQPNAEQTKTKMKLEEDPQAPTNSPLPSNYQSDPAVAGGKEAYVGPLVHQLGNLNVGDHDAPGKHVHFAPQPNPAQNTKLNPKDQDSGISVNNMAVKVGETLAPVYDKVAGTGSAVLSKVYGMVGGENEMKEYLSEKFKPGEEDKALSEVITGALQKEEEKEKKLGKVTVSKEVEERLGGVEDSKREGEDAVAAGRESSGQGVVERLTDAVGLWLGKSEGIQTAKESVGQSHVSDGASG